ncbi:hypothetical protein CsSME_00012362 [Camellia sinensis var. sinensis]
MIPNFVGGSSSRGRKKQGEDVMHSLKVSLEDLYNGTSKKLSLSRNRLCLKCKGKGSKSDTSGRCYGCHGTGMKVSKRQIAPGMIQQMQHVCPECRGSGAKQTHTSFAISVLSPFISVFSSSWLHLSTVQERSSVREIDAHNAKVTRSPRKRKC